MSTIADEIRTHLAAKGQSMRALSLEAGFGESWVKDVLAGHSKRPGAEALARLSGIIGVDLNSIPNKRAMRAADALRLLNRAEPPAGWSSSQVKGARSAIKFYVEKSGAAGPNTLLEPRRVRAWLSSTTAAAQGLSESTFGAYASHLRNVLDLISATHRPIQIRDVLGPWRHLDDAVKSADLPAYVRFSFAPFCAWCHSSGVAIEDVRPETWLRREGGGNSGSAASGQVRHRRVRRRGQGLRAREAEKGSATRRPCASRSGRMP
jgi:lambda repressor-like predicted transcriptional regulator